MKNIFNHKELEGEEVNCLINGNGEIIQTNLLYNPRTVEVYFQSSETSYYTEDGKVLENSIYPTLSFGHKEPKEHDYGESKLAALVKSTTTKQKKKLNFEKWLKKQGVSPTEFCDTLDISLNGLSEYEPHSWLSAGFSWSSSKEGLVFWCDLQDKWIKVLKDADKCNTPTIFGFKRQLEEE